MKLIYFVITESNWRFDSSKICQEDKQSSKDSEFFNDQKWTFIFRMWTNIENSVNCHFLKQLYNLPRANSNPFPNRELVADKTQESYEQLSNSFLWNTFAKSQIFTFIFFGWKFENRKINVCKNIKTTNEIHSCSTKITNETKMLEFRTHHIPNKNCD